MEHLYSLLELQERLGQALATALRIEGPVMFELSFDELGHLLCIWTHQKGRLTRGQLDAMVLPLDLEPRLLPPAA